MEIDVLLKHVISVDSISTISMASKRWRTSFVPFAISNVRGLRFRSWRTMTWNSTSSPKHEKHWSMWVSFLASIPDNKWSMRLRKVLCLFSSSMINVYDLESLDFNNMSRFLNRILGIRVQMQNILFRFFSDVLNAVIVDARRSGSWDLGILGKASQISSCATNWLRLLDLGTGEETVYVAKSKIFVLPTVQTNTIPLQVELHEVTDRRSSTRVVLHLLCFRRSL